jgi:hypothetical protein
MKVRTNSDEKENHKTKGKQWTSLSAIFIKCSFKILQRFILYFFNELPQDHTKEKYLHKSGQNNKDTQEEERTFYY